MRPANMNQVFTAENAAECARRREAKSRTEGLRGGSGASDMEFRRRMHRVIAKKLENEETVVRRRYLVHHPVIQLLERNMDKSCMGELLLSKKNGGMTEAFQGVALEGEIDAQLRQIFNRSGEGANNVSSVLQPAVS